MVYVTKMQPVIYRQMTFEEFLFGNVKEEDTVINKNRTNTVTRCVENIPQCVSSEYIQGLIMPLVQFCKMYAPLYEKDRHSLYREFYIPKKSGGLRKIDAPNEELMNALYSLKFILENKFGLLYHTSAFAYIKGRSTIDAVKRHQKNESKWFCKLDLSNFFGSTTKDFVMKMFSMIYPMSEIVKDYVGKTCLEKALDLAFLDGGLPQGTPVSPTINNVMMIPIDHCLSNVLRDFEKQSYVYTRYADDFIISSKYDFRFKKIEELINEKLAEFGAPFKLNSKKTRYGSSAGSNWNLGVMLNKDNVITVGHEKKRRFQAMLTSYVLDRRNNNPWDLSDIRVMDGYRSYYTMVEKESIEKIINHINEKFSCDVMSMIKEDLS